MEQPKNITTPFYFPPPLALFGPLRLKWIGDFSGGGVPLNERRGSQALIPSVGAEAPGGTGRSPAVDTSAGEGFENSDSGCVSRGGRMVSAGRRLAECGLVCILSSLGVAPVSVAQTGDDFRSEARVRAGPLYLSPSFRLDRFGLESNVFSEPEPKGDFVVSATPRVDAWLPFQRWALVSTTFIAGGDWYARYAGERSFNPDFRYRLEAPWRRLTMSVGGSRLRTRRRPDFEIDVRSNRFSRGLYATVGIKALSRLSVDVEARNRTAGFDSDAIFEGTYLSETLNRRERSGIVSVRWRRTALTTIVLASEVREVRFLRSPDRDSDNLISTVGAEFHSRALISGSGRIGIRHFRARGAAVTDISSVVAQADLSYRISGNTAVTFTAERDINYSFERSAPYFVVHRYGLAMTRRLGRRFDLSSFTSRDLYDYRTERRGHDLRWNLRTELGYRLNPTTRTAVQVGYVARNSTTRARRRHDGLVLGFVVDYDM